MTIRSTLLVVLLVIARHATSQYLNAPRVVRIEAFGVEPNSEVLGNGGYDKTNQYFKPGEVTIHEGDSVEWFWVAGNHNVVQVHNATSVEYIGDTHGINGFGIVSKESGELFWTFRRAGDYHFICEPHISCCQMRGVVHVLPRDPSDGALPDAPGARVPAPPALLTRAPSGGATTRNFLDNLVLGTASHATDRVDGPPRPDSTAALLEDEHSVFVNGDDSEHRVVFDASREGHSSRGGFSSRLTFILVFICVAALVVAYLVFVRSPRRSPGKPHVVLHAPAARFDVE